MNKRAKALDGLISKATDYIKFRLNYSRSTIDKYRRGWKQLKVFMEVNGIKTFNQDVEKLILFQFFKDRTKRELPDSEQYFFMGIQKLSEFQQTGKIKVGGRAKNTRVFTGAVGEIMNEFLEYKRVEDRITIARLRCYKRNLFHFLTYCNQKQISSIKDINLAFILQFICGLDSNKHSITPVHLSTLRCFIRYAFEKGHLPVDFSSKLPRYKSVRQAKLPSIYSMEEIQKLLSSIERTSAVGKRNYAIILIAARLGLRACDIAQLQFDNLHWETSTLHLKQAKTGKDLTLPLLPDVGNAIIDYLKYGRPHAEEPYVFLKLRPPYGHFPSSIAITHIVQRAYIKAGIDIKNKRFGPHALRHTLGFRMLQQSTILPVISEVLGHESCESAKYYLRIDLQSMSGCVLEVPAVAKEFYEQRGGAFYEH